MIVQKQTRAGLVGRNERLAGMGIEHAALLRISLGLRAQRM